MTFTTSFIFQNAASSKLPNLFKFFIIANFAGSRYPRSQKFPWEEEDIELEELAALRKEANERTPLHRAKLQVLARSSHWSDVLCDS